MTRLSCFWPLCSLDLDAIDPEMFTLAMSDLVRQLPHIQNKSIVAIRCESYREINLLLLQIKLAAENCYQMGAFSSETVYSSFASNIVDPLLFHEEIN